MEKLDFNNIEIEFCPNYYDLKRVAGLMYDNKDAFIYVFRTGEEPMSLSKAFAPIFECEAFSMVPEFNIGDKVKQVCNNLRMMSKKKDTESLNNLYLEFASHPKDDVIMGFIESLSKQSMEKQTEILLHFFGNLPESEHRVAIDIIKRGPEHAMHKDQYAYYVCFRNVKTNVKRIVTFKNHASAAIYVMSLIDRVVRKDDCKPIDVLNNTEMLQKVYIKMFPEDGKLKGLKTDLTVDSKGNYSSEKLRLSQYYSDINRAVSENVPEWDYVLPYRCDASTPIRLNPELIKIPKELIPERWAINV